ncbi:MAG TPA: hypothetical protein VNN80_10825 [Polyangiaceae bacterium]|nr:hypothetical protein [Polyangiaceae bacterium]
MNFFGHAWVAGWFSAGEAFILGAMLPDLANMLRAPPPASRHVEVSAGIRLHHDTDRVFHDTEVFRSLEGAGRRELSHAGVPKGARRALAHVGVELLIDAELAARAPAWTGYALALRYGSTAACGERLDWASAETRPRFSALCERLAAAAGAHTQTARIAQRLVAALAGRPRLELAPEHAPLVEPWLAACRSDVSARLPELLAELSHQLAAPEPVSSRLTPTPGAGSPDPTPRSPAR